MTTDEPRATPIENREGSGSMFDGIAKRYDVLNRIMSFGLDQSWRRQTVAALDIQNNDRILDLATGTGDLAFLIAEQSKNTSITGVDPSEKMLAVASQKAQHLGVEDQIVFQKGVAEQLPFASASFDKLSIAFGIRNVPDREAGLREMARVVRPGGKIAILELCEPRRGVFGALGRFHIHTVVPWVGGLLSGEKEYHYLQRSIANFPPPEKFASLMEQNGLSVQKVYPLTFGVVCLFVAYVKDKAA